MTHIVAVAKEIAAAAHLGQVDKAGRPYLGHPGRVAARLAGDPDAEAVAWLHDVVEDTGVTLQDLLAAGLPAHVVHAVDLLTHRPGEDRDDYYRAIALDPLAHRVKLADLADNSDPDRLALLDPATRERLLAKYAHARELLGGLPS